MLKRPLPATWIKDPSTNTITSSFFSTNEYSHSPEPKKTACSLTGPQKYRKIMDSASRRGISFNLSEKTALQLFQQPCWYCHCLPEDLPGVNKQMGLDRIKSEKGYFRDNVVPCCSTCNYMKGNVTREMFIAKCHQITTCHPTTKQ